MNYLTQWYRRPQQIWLRRALFQLHLWTGIALGLYIFIVSISGSAVVFRNELYENYSRVPRGARAVRHTANRFRAALVYLEM